MTLLFDDAYAKNVRVIKVFLCFGITQRDVALCIPPLIRSIKTLLFEYPGIFFAYVLYNKSVLYFQNTDFFFYDPNPFCAYFRR